MVAVRDYILIVMQAILVDTGLGMMSFIFPRSDMIFLAQRNQ